MSDKDLASLGLRIDHSDVDNATSSLGAFQSSARGAAGASRDFGDANDRMSRQMDQMLRMQRETNALLAQSVASTRQAGAEIENQTRRMTQLTLGVAAASAAYEVWGRKAQDTSRQVVQANQQVAASLDQILSRFRELQGSRLDLSQIASNAINVLPGQPALTGAISGPPELNPIAANYLAIQQAALRAGTSSGTLLQGANTGAILGAGDSAGANLATQMSRNLAGMSGEALQAQRVMREFGVTTTDVTRATRQFLEAMNNTRDNERRRAAFSAVFPGADPGMLTRGALAGLNAPPGSEAAYQIRRADELARLRQTSADLQDRGVAGDRTQSRTFFGLIPQGFRQSFGPSFGSDEYAERSRIIALQGQNIIRGVDNGQTGVGDGLEQYLSHLGDRIRNIASAATFGAVSPPNLPMPADDRTSAPPSPAETDQLRQYEMRMGRMTPGAIQSRLTGETQLGSSLVNRGMLSSDRFEQDLRLLNERLERASHPVEEMINNLEEQARLGGMAPGVRQNAQALYQAAQTARAAGQEGLTDPQRSGILQTVDLGRQNRGRELERQTQDQIDQTGKLAKAYADGGGSVQRLTAAEQAHREVIDGLISKTQEASRASELLTKSLADMAEREEQALQRGRIQNQITGMEAAGATAGPVGVRQAQIRGQVLSEFGPDLKTAQDAREAAKTDEELARASQALADVRKRMAEREQQLSTDNANRAQQERALQDRRFNQQQQDLRSITGGAGNSASAAPASSNAFSVRSGADISHGAAAAIADALSHVAGQLPSGDRIQIIEGGNGDPNKHVAGSAHHDWDAVDYQIYDASGRPIPNRGADTTGLYGQTFNNVRSYMQQSNPDIAPYLRFGGNFGTRGSRGDGPDDLMHIDAMGYSRGAGTRAGAGQPAVIVPQGSTVTVTAGAAASNGATTQQILTTRARRQAQQELEGQGVQPSQQDIDRRTGQILSQQGQGQMESQALRNRDTQQAVTDEWQRASTTISGTVREMQAQEDQMRVDTEYRRALAEAQAAEAKGVTGAVAAVNTLRDSALGAASGLRDAQNAVAQSRILRNFSDQQASTQREIGALSSGGTAAYDIQTRAEPIRKQLTDAGMDPAQAEQLAQEMAKSASAADDYKKAILDASNELKGDTKAAIQDLTSGLLSGVESGHKFKDTLIDIGKQLSQIGVKTFVTKPLEQLADNVLSGKGFNFDVGNSGKDTSQVMGTALNGLWKSLGLGGGSSSGGGTSSGVDKATGQQNSSAGGLSSLIGGGNSVLGKALGLGGKGNGRGEYDMSNGGNLLNVGGYAGGGPGDYSSLDAGSSDAGNSGGAMGDYGGGGDDVGVLHGGGRVGFGGASRSVPMYIFMNAPRAHGGASLGPGEVPIIAMKGERVLNPAETKQYESGQRGGDVHVHQYISTPDVASFRATQNQTMTSSRTAADRAYRNT